jgi:glycosyl hydrolase family 2
MRRSLGLAACLAMTCQAAALAAAPPQIISLDGFWNFVPDPSNSISAGGLANILDARPIPVPSSWQADFDDLRDYSGAAWYWRKVPLDAPPAGVVVLLRFGAVDYRAEVYVNGQKAGTHEGGYLPFEFDVTELIRAGDNQIAVRVTDVGSKPDAIGDLKFAEIPHGKQNWYVQTSGLWQGADLEIRPAVRLGTVHISAAADGKFSISAPIFSISKAPPAGVVATAEIRDRNGKTVWQGTSTSKAGEAQAEFSGQVTAPWRWNLSAPVLYTLQVRLYSGDEQTSPFGFRTFETRGGKFYLNGQVLYLRGALDQDFYPETIYTPPSLDAIRDEMRKAKQLGLNLLRCHIKVPDPRYLEAADETGILVWEEIPNWDKLTPASEARATETLGGMAERDWNHPSLVLVSLINESWGANLKEAPDRAWLKQTYEQAKKIVPWLVDDNSACCDNFHLETDLADYHQYNAIPDFAADFDRYVDDLARRPGWLFSPYGDAAPHGDEPLMLSEFGNWGLPHLAEPRPWWFSRSFASNPLTLPAGVEKRFADYHYSSLFKDYDALAEATEEHQFASLEYEVASLRSHPEIQGYVITELTDINWEANGLMDMWRRPKVYAPELAIIQQDDFVAARADQRNFVEGDKVSATVTFSHYSGSRIEGGAVRWQLEGTPLNGVITLPAMEPGTAAAVGKIEFTVPGSSAPSKHLLKLSVEAGGHVIAENVSDPEFYFYPSAPPEIPPPVSFHDPAGKLRRLVSAMREHEYQAPSGKEVFPVLITSVFDDVAKRTLQAGGRVILLASDPQTIAAGLEIMPRSKDDLAGNWISSFMWVRKGCAPFKALGFDRLTGFETQAVTPEAVIQGVPPEEFDDVLSGIFYGWIHSNVATLVQAQAGKGRLLISTFALGSAYGHDPYATELLDAMVNLIVSNSVPHYKIPL